jgi:hypothetical protein
VLLLEYTGGGIKIALKMARRRRAPNARGRMAAKLCLDARVCGRNRRRKMEHGSRASVFLRTFSAQLHRLAAIAMPGGGPALSSWMVTDHRAKAIRCILFLPASSARIQSIRGAPIRSR